MPAGLSDILAVFHRTHGLASIAGLRGGAKALALSRIIRKGPSAPLLVVAASEERAREFFEDCAVFFHPDDAKRLRLFPENSCLPYSRLSPEPESVADRMWALHLLLHGTPLVLVASVGAVMRRMPPKEYLSGGARTIRMKERLDPVELASFLTAIGYEDVGLVEDEGAFARRGGIVDLWPPTLDSPVRLELDGERVASMRLFDPATQRSRGDLCEALVIPVRDVPFDEARRRAAAHRIRGRAEESGLTSRERRRVIETIGEGIAFSGIETLMPLFHESTATLFDYLPPGTRVIVDEAPDVDAAAEAYFREATELARDTASPERIVRPDEILLPPASLSAAMEKQGGLRFGIPTAGAHEDPPLVAAVEGNADVRPLVAGHGQREDMLTPLAKGIREWRDAGMRIVLTCHTELQAKRLGDLFRGQGIALEPFDAPFETAFEMRGGAVLLRTGRLSSGFRWPAEGLAVITDEEIFGAKMSRRLPAARPLEPFTSFAEIAEGDCIVHEQHGIGRYRGLVHLTIEGIAGDFLLLEYLGGDKLYLPVYRLNLVGRYIGAGDGAPFLDRLGGTRWAQAQTKVDASVRLMARELIDLYAAREIAPGHPFADGGAPYEEFCAAFPYDETPDQERAIDDVMRDLSIERPTDRLICGDVGYGKTEVAMRAAFRAAMGGKQVAVLVPTTVLAFQHFETFRRRFGATPVAIEMLSRFRSPKEQREVVAKLARGAVDIVIGTHRLLQKDVRFRDLGLLVIDEEHRFGVRHKERIKTFKAAVDVITLTATPIPRTLNLSLSGIRDISVINTPPVDRLSVTTYVAPFDEGIVRQACLREIARGGQVFFVHNRVETIRSMHDRLARLIPEARIVVGHGQMPEHELERVMIEFLERRADILLCTTIIESGLDIPNANTILIHRADTMGLAQLYQLRGRVGRSNLRAVAYLLIPEEGEVSPIAQKRLGVLKRFTELGSGFQIAMHDLEFRGAGNILGAAQSGHIAAVGYELYAKLLERAVRRLRGKRIEEEIEPELSLKVAAFLPEGYVPDPGTRIDLYRRLANRESPEEIAIVGDELADRFGPLPAEAENLLGVMEIKVLARQLRIRQISFDGATFSCQLDPSTPLDPQAIISVAEKEPGRYRIVSPDKLLFSVEEVSRDDAGHRHSGEERGMRFLAASFGDAFQASHDAAPKVRGGSAASQPICRTPESASPSLRIHVQHVVSKDKDDVSLRDDAILTSAKNSLSQLLAYVSDAESGAL